MKVNWLSRHIAAHGPYLALCLNEDDFTEVLKHLKVKENVPYIRTANSDATCHHFESINGLTCVVCLGDVSGRDGVEIAGLLVHEAVHIWQAYSERIGEKQPGREQEAYAVQSVAQELMSEYARRTTRG